MLDYEAILCYVRKVSLRRGAACSVLLIDEATDEQANPARIRGHRTMNARIAPDNIKFRGGCARWDVVRFTDGAAELVDASGNLRLGLAVDSIHLTDQGTQVWAAAVRLALQPGPSDR